MSSNTYSIVFTEQVHNVPEEIGFPLVRFINMEQTLLRFPLDKLDQVVLVHLIAATDIGTARTP